MISCSICLEDIKCPVALICGHVFCTECIIRTVQAVKPYKTLHPCPSCRQPFSIVNINPSIVPPHLRPYLTPSVRRLFLDNTPSTSSTTCPVASSSSTTTTTTTPASTRESDKDKEIARLHTELAVLRNASAGWKRRAELHAAATLGLLGLARMTKDYAMQTNRENEALRARLAQRPLRQATDEDHPTVPDFFRGADSIKEEETERGTISLGPVKRAREDDDEESEGDEDAVKASTSQKKRRTCQAHADVNAH